ncbi:MAG: HAD family phosphatase [Alphaproteobacteria bacterium]|nr:HAD family phosphatase [Alphaproteobacteria bacterium]
MISRRSPATKISAIVSDVDGTVVTDDKRLTERSRAAVAAVRQSGLPLCLISSRPPRGFAQLRSVLEIVTPCAGFNGGVIVAPDGSVIEQHLLPSQRARDTVGFLTEHGIDIWLFSGPDWLLTNTAGPYIDHEKRTVGFDPVVVRDFALALDSAAKIVGVSKDFDLLARCEIALAKMMGDSASVARSQLYYLDTTAPLANKGAGMLALASQIGVPPAEIAVIGDGGNDVAMFEHAGLSIAMGNAQPAVKAQADLVTWSNAEDGFAMAIERFILGGER